MDKADITAYLEKKNLEYEGICHPKPCLSTVTATDIHAIISTASLDPNYMGSSNIVTYGTDVAAIMLTAPLCLDDADCDRYNVVAYMLPEGRAAQDCLGCVQPCGEIEESDSVVDITALPTSYKDKPCLSECAKKIKWSQDHDVKQVLVQDKTTGLFELTDKKIPLNTITTEVDIPNLCGIIGLSMEFEISDCYAYWDLSKIGAAAIPDGGGLERIHGGKWVHTWSFTDQDSCWFPGEYIVCYAHFDKTFCDCNPMPIAWGWYSTPCLTSATIQGCGLIDDVTQEVKKAHSGG